MYRNFPVIQFIPMDIKILLTWYLHYQTNISWWFDKIRSAINVALFHVESCLTPSSLTNCPDLYRRLLSVSMQCQPVPLTPFQHTPRYHYQVAVTVLVRVQVRPTIGAGVIVHKLSSWFWLVVRSTLVAAVAERIEQIVIFLLILLW